MDAEGLGDGGAGDVRVQHGAVVAPALHLGGQQAGDQALAHAALAADHGDDLVDLGIGVELLAEALGLRAGGAVLPAGGAIVCALAHEKTSFLKNVFCIRKTKNEGLKTKN